MTFGSRVRQSRLKKGYTQTELAIKCGYTSKAAISKIEKDNMAIPQDKIALIAESLDVEIGWLITGQKEESPKPVGDKAMTIAQIADMLDEKEQDQIIEVVFEILKKRNSQ